MLATDVSTRPQATAEHINYSPILAKLNSRIFPEIYIGRGTHAMGQLMVLGSEPAEPNYSPLWRETIVRWKRGVTPTLGPPVIDIHVLSRDEIGLVSRVFAHRSPAQHRERLARQDEGVFAYLIAWDRTEPVGHVGIDWPDDRQPERFLQWGALAIVHDLEVVPARRNEGVGRALMLELENRVRERGLAAIGLSTGLDAGYAAARHLYRSLGYVELPRTLHIESARLPSDRPIDLYLEVVTDWTKTLTV